MEGFAFETMPNNDWIAGLRAGRTELTSALYKRIRKGLTAALAGRSDVHHADLDDFTQDAIVRVIDKLDTFRGDSAFTTWAMAIAVRISLTALRKRRWKDVQLDSLSADATISGSENSESASSGARTELLAALRTAIDEALTPRQRQTLMGELDGIPQVILAERLGSTPGAIYKSTHDARKKLRTALAKMGFDAQTVRETLAGIT